MVHLLWQVVGHMGMEQWDRGQWKWQVSGGRLAAKGRQWQWFTPGRQDIWESGMGLMVSRSLLLLLLSSVSSSSSPSPPELDDSNEPK